jgi:flagellar motor switch protein FliM
MTEILRRKIDRARLPQAEGAPGADRGWRLALARATRDAMGLDIDFRQLSITRAGLAEVLDLAPLHALVALLDGPQGGLGVLMLGPSVTSALIEMQTLGRLSGQAPPARRPTRIDAAMVAGVVDRALAGLDQTLAEEADFSWAGGFRYASYLDEVRPLGLLLEEESYRVLSAEIALGGGGRTGTVILVLPAVGRGERPEGAAGGAPDTAPQFTAALAARVEQAECRLDAVIGRLVLPIGRILALMPGETLDLPQAGLDSITLETADGRRIARARLGQNRGMRALKIVLAESATRTAPVQSPVPSPVPAALQATPPAEAAAPPLPADDLRAAS